MEDQPAAADRRCDGGREECGGRNELGETSGPRPSFRSRAGARHLSAAIAVAVFLACLQGVSGIFCPRLVPSGSTEAIILGQEDKPLNLVEAWKAADPSNEWAGAFWHIECDGGGCNGGCEPTSYSTWPSLSTGDIMRVTFSVLHGTLYLGFG